MTTYDLSRGGISVEDAVMTLAEGLYLDGKVAFDEATQARPVAVEGVPGIALSLPDRPYWTRLRLDLDRPRPKGAALLALRVVLRIDPVIKREPLALRAALAAQVSGTARIDPVQATVQDLRVEGAGLYVLGGLCLRDPAAEGPLEFRLDLPRRAQSQVTLLAIEAEWHAADLSRAAKRTLAEEGIQAAAPFAATPCAPEATVADTVAAPSVVAASERVSGLSLKGHVVTVPRGDRIEALAGGAPLDRPADLPVELAPGVRLPCGFDIPLTELEIGEKHRTLSLRRPEAPGGPYAQVPIPPEILQVLRRDGARAAAPGEGAVELFFYPDYTVTNPYQRLMYGSMPRTAARGGGVDDAIARLEGGGAGARVVLHLHWLNPLLAGARSAGEADLKRRRFREKLRHFVRLGGVVLWTVHNTVSHDAKFREVETQLGQDVADLAHRIHVHSERLLPVLAESYRLPPSKLLVQPHPSYVNVYPDYVDRAAARKRLELPEAARVVLFQGQLRPYKGIDQLVRAFAEVAEAHPDAILLIVGKPVHPYTPGYVTRKLQAFDRVRVIEQFVPDAELQWYYRAADWVALPYLNILTSGSLMCAMSFSRPCIAPDIGMIGDVLSDGRNGVLYDGDDAGGLARALAQALEVGPAELGDMQEAALASVRDLSWGAMGRALRRAVDESADGARIVTLEFDDGARDCRLSGPAFPPARPARTAVVILNYEHIDDVARLVDTLRASPEPDFDIYVVDNASPSLTEVELRLTFPDVHLLCLPENLGYAAGNNAALRLIADVDHEFVWILNPDMVVTPEALAGHLAAAEAHPEHAIFGATILKGGLDRRIASAGCFVNLEDGLSTGHMYAGERLEVLPDAPYEADFVTGASVFLRKSVLATIGLMPEDYFLYFEETHWLLSAKARGVPSLVLPQVILSHYKRSEEGGLPAKYYFYYYVRNALIFYERMTGGSAETLRDRLMSGFVGTWLGRIEARRPDLVALYRHLALTAVADGLAGRAGKVDLAAIEYAADETAPPPPEAAPVAEIVTAPDGTVGGIVTIFSEVLPAAQVAVAVDGRVVATTAAKRDTRSEIEGTQRWTFELALPETLPRGLSMSMRVLLNGRTVPRAGRAIYLPPPEPEYRGRIDGVAGYICNGWALNTKDDAERLEVEILSEGRVVARGVACDFRPDLRRNGLGDGHSAFRLRLPKAFTDGESRKLTLRIADTDQVLYERHVVGNKPAGGVEDLTQPPGEMLEDLFYARQLWLSGEALDDLPFGRFCAQVEAALAARHAARPEAERVSVIMPAFNRARTIRPAIDSVRAQSYANWELLVVDDGSTDDTVAVLRDLLDETGDDRIRLIELPENRGVSAARNAGLAEARGEVIAYLDSDNTWRPDFLRIMAGELMARPRPGAVYCGQRILQLCGLPEDPVEEEVGLRMGAFHLALLENRNYIDLNCFVHHRRLTEELGGFAEEIRRLVDWELILRYARQETPHFVRAALSNYWFDRADNQITRLENYDGALAEFKRLSAAHARKPVPDAAIRPLDIGIVGRPGQDLEVLVQRAVELGDRIPAGAPVKVVLCPAPGTPLPREPELPAGMRLAPAGAGSAEAGALRARRAGADLLLLSPRALPRRGWLRHLNAALAARPEAGMLVSRRMVPGPQLRHKPRAVPFGHAGFDACIALREDTRRMIDPSLDPALNLMELSEADGFFAYVPADCASALAPVFEEPAPADLPPGEVGAARMARASRVLRVGLDRRIVYCGDVEVYDM